LAVGKLLEAAEEAATILAGEGTNATVWDVGVVRPLNAAMVEDAGKHGFVVTVEDGIRNGGAGNFIADAIADLKASRRSPPVLNLGVPTMYIPHNKPERILANLGLDGPGIAASIFKTMEGEAGGSPVGPVTVGSVRTGSVGAGTGSSAAGSRLNGVAGGLPLGVRHRSR
jgi:deoxyxylulose-5-phosphate synthase